MRDLPTSVSLGTKYSGVAVHVAARVVRLAGPREVLVTETVRAVVAGSELRFRERGSHELKGLAGVWPLYAAVTAAPILSATFSSPEIQPSRRRTIRWP